MTSWLQGFTAWLGRLRMMAWARSAQVPRARPAELDRDGSVAIEGGRVLVSEPRGGGRWPVLRPGPTVVVRVDGALLNGPAVVHAGQEIVLEVAPAPERRTMTVQVEEDGMTARLLLGPTRAHRHEILDQAPAPVVVPMAVRREVQLPSPSAADVATLLAAEGIVHGIDQDAIQGALASSGPVDAVIARGTPAEPTDAGGVELRLPPPGERLQSVPAGSVLAVIGEPRQGRYGQDVFGRLLPPPERSQVRLEAGHGTTFSPTGRQLVATAAGVPTLVQVGGALRIEIRPLLVYPGNLERASLPRDHDGDVLVEGWVEPGVLLVASGRIQVIGGVQGAELRAGHAVHIGGGCISAVVRQGGAAALSRALEQHLRDVAAELGRLRQVTQQAISHPRYARTAGDAGLGPLVVLLVQHRFARLPDLLRQVIGLVAMESGAVAERVSEVVARVEQVVLRGDVRQMAQVDALLDDLRSLQAALDGADAAPSGSVVVYQLLHAQVYAAGSVEVTGPGAEHSDIFAGGGVHIHGRLRLGRVHAGGSVRVGWVGVPAGMQTLISVPAHCTIAAGHVYPGTVCELGSRPYRFLGEERSVNLRLDAAGQVLLSHY